MRQIFKKLALISSMFFGFSAITFSQSGLVPDSPEYTQAKLSGALGNVGYSALPVPKNLVVNSPVSTMDDDDPCYIPHNPLTWTEFAGNDDGSIPITFQFDFDFYGDTYTSGFLNNNGNVTFLNGLSAFTASGFPITTAMVAPFWGDVDTRCATCGEVWYLSTPTAFYINWVNVGYFPNLSDKTNTFQLIITDGADPVIGVGNNVAFHYGDMQWTTGGASSGINGFGGVAATVGANRGNNTDFFQIGRFDEAGSAFDGPYLENDGIDYLDSQCFAFSLDSEDGENIAPIVQQLTPATSTICVGETVEISYLITGPEQDQNIEVSLSEDDDITAVLNSTAVLGLNSGTISLGGIIPGSYTLILTGTDNGEPALSTAATITLIIEACEPVCDEDLDEDGICDDIDDCIGDSDALGICNGDCTADENGNGICDSDEEPSGSDCGTWKYYLADVTSDNNSQIYEVTLDSDASTATLSLLKTVDYPVHIAFNESDGLLYLVRSSSGAFRSLDVSAADGALGAEIELSSPFSAAVTAAFNADGKLVIGDQNSDEITCVDILTGVRSPYAMGDVAGGDIAFGLDGRPYLATRSGNILYQINPGMANSMLGSVPNNVTGMGVMPSGNLLFSALNSAGLSGRTAEGANNGVFFTYVLDGEAFISTNGDFASGCADSQDEETGCNYRLYYTHNPSGSSAYSLNEVTLNNDGTATINTLVSGMPGSHIALTPDGGTIYLVGSGNQLRSYDVASATFNAPVNMTTASGASVSNPPAAVVGGDGTLYVATGNKVYTVDPATGAAAQFGPNRTVNGGDLVLAPTGAEGAEELWLITRNNNRLTNVLSGAFVTLPVTEINGASVLENGNLLLADGNGAGLFKEVDLTSLEIVATYETGLALFNGDLAGNCTSNPVITDPCDELEPGECYAATVTYVQGTALNNGGMIAGNRTNALNALGAPEGTDNLVFVSLGYGGSVTVTFNGAVPNGAGDDIEVTETTFNNPIGCNTYREYADVSVSQDGATWYYIGTVCKSDNMVDISDADVETPLTCVNYVRIENNDDLTTTPDGFDVDGVRAIHNCSEEGAAGSAVGSTDEEVITFSELVSFPNPTTGVSQVEFMSGDNGRATVEVYDMSGRSVATIFNQEVQAGAQYRTNFDGTSLPNGIYVYRLTTGSETIIEKFMIAK